MARIPSITVLWLPEMPPRDVVSADDLHWVRPIQAGRKGPPELTLGKPNQAASFAVSSTIVTMSAMMALRSKSFGV
jgi:hypothetical protein